MFYFMVVISLSTEALQGQDYRARLLWEDRILIFRCLRWEYPFLRAVGEDWNPGLCFPRFSSRLGVTSSPFSNPKAKLLTVVYKLPSPYVHYQLHLLSNPLPVTHFPPATQASWLSFTHSRLHLYSLCLELLFFQQSAWLTLSPPQVSAPMSLFQRGLRDSFVNNCTSLPPLFIPLPCFIFLYRAYYHAKYYISYSFI